MSIPTPTTHNPHHPNKMLPSGPPTEQEIMKIARRTTDIIRSCMTSDVCLFGSAASALWADIDRVPNVRRATLALSIPVLFRLKMRCTQIQDVDIVVSGYSNAENIKEIIDEADERYYRELSKKPGKTHHILYCRLPGWSTDSDRRVKVDILVPPTLKLPEITYTDVFLFGDIPVMPLFDLLVMKTQGWWDHLNSRRSDFQAKLVDDVTDVLALLDRAREGDVSFEEEANEYRHTEEFMSHALALANRFVSAHDRHQEWRDLEFPL